MYTEEVAEEFLPTVMKKAEKIVAWTHNRVYRDIASEEDLKTYAMTALFEAASENPDKKTLVKRAVRNIRKRLQGPESVFNDQRKRVNNRKSNPVDIVWNEDNQPEPAINKDPIGPTDVPDIFEVLVKRFGVQLATIFILNKGYGQTPSQIAQELYHVSRDTTEFYKHEQRIYRSINRMTDTLNADRTSRSVFNRI